MIGNELPPIVVKMKGDIAELLAQIEVVKQAIRDARSEANKSLNPKLTPAQRQAVSQDLRNLAAMDEAIKARAKMLKGKIVSDAVKKMFDEAEGKTDQDTANFAQRFWNNFRKQMKKGSLARGPGWLPWVGLAMPLAPALITGLAGSAGLLATAGFAAASGLAALGLSAKEVLAPVKQAFTVIDKLTTTNAVAANATALRTWLRSSPTLARTTTGRLTAASLRAIAQRQALGGSLGFLTNPNVNWYTLSKAQQRNLVLAAQSTTGMPTSERAQIEALMQERQAYSALNPGQQRALFQYTNFDQAMVNAQTKSAPQVLALWAAGLKAITPALKFLPGLAQAAARALMPLVHEIGQGIKSQGFANFMKILDQTSQYAIKNFGKAAIDIGKGLGHIFEAFARNPAMKIVIGDLREMARAFNKDTASKTGGFAKFMNEVKQNAPTIDDLMRHLVSLLGQIITDLGTGFGQMELKGLNDFIGAIDWLGKHASGITGFTYNFAALILVTSRFGSVKLMSVALLSLGRALLGINAVVKGLLFLKILGIGFKQAAMTAILWMGNMVKAGVIWAAKMIAQAATALTGWVLSMVGIETSTEVATSTIIATTAGVALAIGLIVLGIYELYKHWHTVWGFIKRVAEDAWNFIYKGWGKFLLPLLGPAGLLALGVIEVWKIFHLSWGKIRIFVVETAKFLMDVMLTFARVTLQAAVDAFGWVPGLGPKLKTALKAVQNFTTEADKFLNNLAHPRNVILHIVAGTNGLPGGTAGGPFGGGGGGHSGGGHSGGTSSPPPPNIHAHAAGTSFAPAGWAWVGEKGPELVHFPTAGATVIPNHMVGGYANGAGLNFAVTTPNMHSLESSILASTNVVIGHLVNIFKHQLGSTGGPPGHASGAYQAYAQSLFPRFGWGSNQIGSLIALWNRESGWNPIAQNPTSTAFGIAQFLDTTWAGFGPKTSNPYLQIFYGEEYIRQRYGSPAGAWAHEISAGWYGNGGRIPPGGWGVVGERGEPELVRAGSGGATVTPMGKTVNVKVYTQEINPVKHAAELGWELARRT